MKNKLIRMAVKMAYKQHITTYYKKRALRLSTKKFCVIFQLVAVISGYQRDVKGGGGPGWPEISKIQRTGCSYYSLLLSENNILSPFWPFLPTDSCEEPILLRRP